MDPSGKTNSEVIGRCVPCNRIEGIPYAIVMPPDLPNFRVSENLYSSTSKANVCLFTCCLTYAVHLELTPDLSVSSFLLFFCRFASQRGLPMTLITDSVNTLKASSKDITKIVQSSF